MEIKSEKTENNNRLSERKKGSFSHFDGGENSGQKNDFSKDETLIKISQAAKSSAYSKNYLLSSARGGKLKGKMIGGTWYTKKKVGRGIREDFRKKKKGDSQKSFG